MKRRVLAVSLLAAMVLVVSFAEARQAPPAPPDRAKAIAAARDIMQKARYGDLVTIGEDGQPQARVVDAFAPEPDLTIWIGTNPLTRKVAEIRRDPRVTLLYFDTARDSFVTVIGKGEVVTDAGAKAKHWKDAWSNLYKDKFRGDDYVLIRVKPSRLEIVSVALGFVNDPKTWRPVTVDLTKQD